MQYGSGFLIHRVHYIEDKPTAWSTSSSCCAIRVVRRLTNFNGRRKIGLSGQEYRVQLQAPN